MFGESALTISLPKRKYKEVYDKRAKDEFEEKYDESRDSRFPFFLRYCLQAETNLRVLDVEAADEEVLERFREGRVGRDIAVHYCSRMAAEGIQNICRDAEFLPFRDRSFGNAHEWKRPD